LSLLLFAVPVVVAVVVAVVVVVVAGFSSFDIANRRSISDSGGKGEKKRANVMEMKQGE